LAKKYQSIARRVKVNLHPQTAAASPVVHKNSNLNQNTTQPKQKDVMSSEGDLMSLGEFDPVAPASGDHYVGMKKIVSGKEKIPVTRALPYDEPRVTPFQESVRSNF
jgi:hypothetical protein